MKTQTKPQHTPTPWTLDTETSETGVILDSKVGVYIGEISSDSGMEEYRKAHQARFDSPIEDDYVLAAGIVDIAKGIRTLLNGEIGRLDGGTLDGYLVGVLKRCGKLV